MRKHTLTEISKALRYLKSRGWSIGVVHQTAKDTGLTALELADKMKGRE